VANIFLSQALRAAGTPIVNALGYRAAEQRQFTQMRNALATEYQAQDAREQNSLAELANLNVAAQGLPEATNQLNALIAGSATGQVNPNDVGKAAAQIAKINQELPQRANALIAEVQDAREKKAYLENDPFTRGIMSGDIKTMNALSGASLVKYPVKEPIKDKWSFETVKGKVGDKEVTEVYAFNEATKERELIRRFEGSSDTLQETMRGVNSTEYVAFRKLANDELQTFLGRELSPEFGETFMEKLSTLGKNATPEERNQAFRETLLEYNINAAMYTELVAHYTDIMIANSKMQQTSDQRVVAQLRKELDEAQNNYNELLAKMQQDVRKQRGEKNGVNVSGVVKKGIDVFADPRKTVKDVSGYAGKAKEGLSGFFKRVTGE